MLEALMPFQELIRELLGDYLHWFPSGADGNGVGAVRGTGWRGAWRLLRAVGSSDLDLCVKLSAHRCAPPGDITGTRGPGAAAGELGLILSLECKTRNWPTVTTSPAFRGLCCDARGSKNVHNFVTPVFAWQEFRWSNTGISGVGGTADADKDL